MRIVFMGTPDFALFSLRALCEAGEDVVGVVTQPDKPRGRGYALTPPPVKVYAEERGLPVYQPSTLRGEAFAAVLRELDPELIVVAAYGKILPPEVLGYPRLGCINVHGSLLPKYRGAAPMQRAIMNGETVTGVTIMYMAEGLDTGDMLLRAEVPIERDDDFETVHDKLGAVGAMALLDAITALRDGTAERVPQDDSLSTYAAKIEKADCLIDFSKPAEAVHDLIRGLSPVPLAFTHTPDGKLLKVLSARLLPPDGVTVPDGVRPGTVVRAEGEELAVACGDGRAVAILRVLPEGRPRMSAADFLRGRKLNEGDLLS